MTSFTLRYPPVIRLGWGCRQELPGLVRERTGAPVFWICSRSAWNQGLVSPLRQELPDAGLFLETPPEPGLETVEAAARLVRASGAGAVVGIGGGSVLDVAKAVAVIAPSGHPAAEVFRQPGLAAAPALPSFLLPTTAGSGTEVTVNSVLIDRSRGIKASIRHPGLIAAAALVDPELTLSCPPALTAASGMDALVQAVESYLSLRAHDLSRMLAAKATRLLLDHLETAVRDGSSRAAREAVAEGSLLAGMAFSQSGLGAVHGLAHPLGLALGMPHGQVCAILLPHVLELNRPACGIPLQELAASTVGGSAELLLERLRHLHRSLGIPDGFRKAGLVPGHFPEIVKNCRSNSMAANPRPLTDPEILALLHRLAEQP